ncbi:MAG TPA: DsbA family protein [Tenuifilaceae bacterium]|nr:DsbA family protein [Bacteroidales bacterium]HOA09949.1 DsbA family protein [Tenuifilaceae bacterium]HOC36833.1 DsbA family protein [Tenuifilaceae bacterium]HPA67523.1 DsbA family protein [Tenuifilaceae bacterium]HPS05428.1 DsbA family protein [Tenuifilaceae bacterium]
MQVEFFHDVLCAWCFALSPRMRRLVAEFPEIEVIHRSFALASDADRLVEMFGSKEAAKREILNHWRNANENDDEHRIHTEDMALRTFDYPYSMPGLLACKSAELQGGQLAHWNMFDRIQKAHLVETQNIADFNVLLQCADEVGLDTERFKNDFESDATLDAIYQDSYRAKELGVNAVPSLLINGRKLLSGAHKYETLKELIQRELIGK